MKLSLSTFITFCLFTAPCLSNEIDIRSRFSLPLLDQDVDWQNHGVGLHRGSQGKLVNQTLLSISRKISISFNLDADLWYVEDGLRHNGFSQIQLKYKPPSHDALRWKMRAGFFYPSMSLENISKGWNSPFTYSFSGINSWFAEELRVSGIEGTIFNNINKSACPFTWEATIGLFKGNDTLGSLLSWRGFAFHDRQSIHSDRVNFSKQLPIIQKSGLDHPAWTEPFKEIDGNVGFYAGIHIRNRAASELRVYHYDNRGDGISINSERLLSWDTSFKSVAVKVPISERLVLLAQGLNGTANAKSREIDITYSSFFIMGAFDYEVWKFSIRAELGLVEESESDLFSEDINDHRSTRLTMSVKYKLNRHLTAGLEYSNVEGNSPNRNLLSMPSRFTENSLVSYVEIEF